MKTARTSILTLIIIGMMLGTGSLAFGFGGPCTNCGGNAGEAGDGCDAGNSNDYEYTRKPWQGMLTINRVAGEGTTPVTVSGTVSMVQDCNCTGTITSGPLPPLNRIEFLALTPDWFRGDCMSNFTNVLPASYVNINEETVVCKDSDLIELVGVGEFVTHTATTIVFPAQLREYWDPTP